MASVVIRTFGGMLPRYAEQHLPETAAALAQNCRLDSGELQALKQPVWAATIIDLFNVGSPKRVYYADIPEINPDAPTLIPFADETVDFLQAPLVNDAHNRMYYTSENDYPRYNTGARLAVLSQWLKLGIPRPPNAPTVTPSGGTPDLEISRAYVYTLVTAYGEESAPSPPSAVTTGNDDGSWLVGGIQTSLTGNGTYHNVTHVRVYRTITGVAGAVDYFQVSGDLPFGTTTQFTDTLDANEASLRTILISDDWEPPPENMMGLVAHPNGFLVGFWGRDIYFSEPYRPHAWPVKYILSVRYDIVGIVVVGQSVVVVTNSSPFIATGIRPDGMSLLEVNSPEGCISRRGVVSGAYGAIYPGIDGLMLLQGTTVTNLTEKFLSRREWQLNYANTTMSAAEYNGQYVAFYDDDKGFIVNLSEISQLFVELDGSWWQHDAMQGDPLTGEILLVRNNTVFKWNPVSGAATDYIWRSKVFDTPEPLNFGAYRISSDADVQDTDDVENAPEKLLFNTERMAAAPLNPFNFHAMNKVRIVTLPTSMYPQNSQAYHKSMLYTGLPGWQADTTTAIATLHLKVWADGELVYDQDVPTTDPLRLPTGFRRNLWQFELSGNANVKSFKVAETGKELARV